MRELEKEDVLHKKGLEIIEIFGIKKAKSRPGLYQTEWGVKTPTGIANMVLRLSSDIRDRITEEDQSPPCNHSDNL